MDNTQSLGEPTSKNSLSASSNNKKVIFLAITALASLILCIVIAVILIIVITKKDDSKADENNATTTTISNSDETASFNDSTTTSTINDSTDASVLYFTHNDYPELKIPYPSSWNMSLEQVENEDYPGAKITTIVFAKENYKLKLTLTPVVVFGGTQQCSYDVNLIQIKDHWYRIGENGQFYYDAYIYEKGVTYSDGKNFEEFFADGGYENPENVDYCNFDVPIGGTDTVYVIPESVGYKPGEKYLGYIDIALEIDGTEDENLTKEADEIVISSVFWVEE